MKILFTPFHTGCLYTNQSLPKIVGVPTPNKISIASNDYELSCCTPNTGNMIHVEAPAKIFRYDITGSAYTSLLDLEDILSTKPDEFARDISQNFDYLVLSEANLIRLQGIDRESSEKQTTIYSLIADLLEFLTIPFAVFGVGLHLLDELPSNKGDFDQNILKYLSVCIRKGTLVAVRGRSTRDYMQSILGLQGNIKVTGCPSFFVYPNNIRNIKYKPITNKARVISAGYLRPNEIKWQNYRINALRKIADNFNADYVFQDDIYDILDLGERIGFNEATGELDYMHVVKKLNINHVNDLAFRSFFHYKTPIAWRMRMSNYDFYIGDRLHCGVVALQSGIPSVFLYNDNRVKEIVDLFNIPNIDVRQVGMDKPNVMDLIVDSYTLNRMNEFKEIYEERLAYFKHEVGSVGIET